MIAVIVMKIAMTVLVTWSFQNMLVEMNVVPVYILYYRAFCEAVDLL